MAETQKTMGHKNGVTDYSKILSTGRENAMPGAELAARVGFESVRALRQDISQSRRAGQPICSTTQAGGGYYMAANRGELLQFVQSMEHRIKNTACAITALRRQLDTIEGQMTMDDIMHAPGKP